jgi:hypothetical protein
MTLVVFFLFLSCWWAMTLVGIVVVARYLALTVLRWCDWRRARRNFARARVVKTEDPRSLTGMLLDWAWGFEMGLVAVVWVWSFLMFGL